MDSQDSSPMEEYHHFMSQMNHDPMSANDLMYLHVPMRSSHIPSQSVGAGLPVSAFASRPPQFMPFQRPRQLGVDGAISAQNTSIVRPIPQSLQPPPSQVQHVSHPQGSQATSSFEGTQDTCDEVEVAETQVSTVPQAENASRQRARRASSESEAQKPPKPKRARKGKDQQTPSQAEDQTTVTKKQFAQWKDAWIVQLIHIRGSMSAEFSKPPKQGVDIWSKVATQLASLFPEFDKDGEACRKCWGRMYESYKKDKVHNAIFGNDRKITCLWYDLVDEYIWNRANVCCDAHASAVSSVSSSEDNTTAISNDPGSNPVEDIALNEPPKAALDQASSQVGRQKKDRKKEESLHDMASTARLMLASQKANSEEKKAFEERRLGIMDTLATSVSSLFDVIKNLKKD